MNYLSLFFLLFSCVTVPAVANEADVIAVKATLVSKRSYRFDVTVRHADTGREHYADRWEVLAPDGSILGTRALAHPHTNEQPFTRSLSGVKIPTDLHQVTIRVHDSKHAFGGKTIVVDLD